MSSTVEKGKQEIKSLQRASRSCLRMATRSKNDAVCSCSTVKSALVMAQRVDIVAAGWEAHRGWRAATMSLLWS